MPGGLAEQELRALVGGGALGDTPALLWGEIQHVLAPLIEERVSDGQPPPSLLLPLPISLLYTHSFPP
jgi:hypothetical protein